MIRALKGIIKLAVPPLFVIDVQGVGYEVFSATIKNQVGDEGCWSIFMVVKEDSQTLYGFNDEQERGLFALLLSVNGVGPKSALAIMNQLTPTQISEALQTSDPSPFKKVKGIGKKVAERIVLDLSGSINREVIDSDNSLSLTVASALENLGYSRREYQALIKQLPEGSVEDQITWALQRLAQS